MNNNNEWPIDLSQAGFPGDAYLEASTYTYGGGAAISIYCFDPELGAMALYNTLTCNVEDAFLLNPETDIIVNHNLSQEAIDAVVDSGFMEEDGYSQVRSGYVTMPIHAMTDNGREWFFSVIDQMEDVQDM